MEINILEKLNNYFKSIIYPKNDDNLLNKLVSQEMYSYFFCSFFCQKNEQIIMPLLKSIVKKIILIIKNYYNKFHTEYYKTQNSSKLTLDAFIINVITVLNKNSGSFTINAINFDDLYDNINLRQAILVIEEFIHNGKHIYSWFLYNQELTDILELDINVVYLTKKYKFICEVISGSQQKKFDNLEYAHSFVKQFLGKKYEKYLFESNIYPWQFNETPSINELCNLAPAYMHSIKEIHDIEFQRFTNYLSHSAQKKIYNTEEYSPSTICNDVYGKYDIGLTNDMLIYPKLSSLELEQINVLDNQYLLESQTSANNINSQQKRMYIPWKGGCCYYYTNENSVTAEISRQLIKPRTTSYSGHTILDLNLMSILDPNFEKTKYIYIFAILCSMIPFCHHTTHEVLCPATFYGIDYDIELNFQDNYRNFCSVFDTEFGLNNSFEEIDNKIKDII